MAEFNRLLKASKIDVRTADQAEDVADLYRQVNPENYEDLTQMSNLLDVKQAAERDCHANANSFVVGDKAFMTWWSQADRLYANLEFQETAVRHGKAYVVQWIEMSSPSATNCGGTPLRAKLEIALDGHVNPLTVSPVRETR